jgi:hypothetical protein
MQKISQKHCHSWKRPLMPATPIAMETLSILYANGKGVAQDYGKRPPPVTPPPNERFRACGTAPTSLH